jgi:predicted dehydrogenase
MEVFCRDAMLWLDDDDLGPLHIETSAGEEVLEPPVAEWLDRAAAALGLPAELVRAVANYGTAVKEFLDALAAGRSGRPDAADALMAHRLVDAAYRSSSAGGVPLPAAL